MWRKEWKARCCGRGRRQGSGEARAHRRGAPVLAGLRHAGSDASLFSPGTGASSLSPHGSRGSPGSFPGTPSPSASPSQGHPSPSQSLSPHSHGHSHSHSHSHNHSSQTLASPDQAGPHSLARPLEESPRYAPCYTPGGRGERERGGAVGRGLEGREGPAWRWRVPRSLPLLHGPQCGGAGGVGPAAERQAAQQLAGQPGWHASWHASWLGDGLASWHGCWVGQGTRPRGWAWRGGRQWGLHRCTTRGGGRAGPVGLAARGRALGSSQLRNTVWAPQCQPPAWRASPVAARGAPAICGGPISPH